MKTLKNIGLIFKSNFNIKNVLLIALPIFVFFVLKDLIYYSIESNLLVSHNFSNLFFDLLFITTFVTIFIFIIIKFGKRKRYIPSNLEFYLLFVILITLILIYLFPSSNWKFLKIKNIRIFKDISYAFPIFLLLIVSFIWGVINIVWETNKKGSIKNFLLEDNPKTTENGDVFDNENLALKILDVLYHNNFEKSFSIGIIGPWGNGKSSLMNFVSNKVIEDNKDNEIIQVKFSPYLIHSGDYIGGFLSVLSKELSPYNGNISELFHRYAKSISNINKYFKIIDLPSEKDNSSTDLYERINIGIKKINKKIVVYLDDLDRLDDKEILQILKLIRNSANFKNTIFLVAMDKDYVLKRLLNNNKNLNTVFIDKFFQLEIYLPQINPVNLNRYFIKKIEQTNTIGVKVKNEVIDSVNNKQVLFEDYIKNYRDLKKLINQITFESQFIPGEIAVKDLINFILLKMKYPTIISLIIENEGFFFEIENNIYTLRESTENKNKGLSDSLFADFSRIKIKLDNYKLFDDFHNNESIIKEQTSHLDAKDLKLILITLIKLFGKYNSKDSSSIRHKANFRKLMQQNLLEEDVSLKSFEKLLLSEKIEVDLILYNEEKKIKNLLIRLEYYIAKNDDERKILLKIYNILLNIHGENYDSKLLTFISNIAGDENFYSSNNKYIINNIFGNESVLSNYNKLIVLGDLWYSKSDNKLWGVDQGKIKELTIKTFKSYLNEHGDDSLWKAGDFSFFRVYHRIKHIIPLRNNINELINSFWENNELEILISQMINIQGVDMGVYEISSVVEEIFGSKLEFTNFVLNHKNISTPSGVEMSKFINLSQIVEFKINICFTFIKNTSLLKILEKNKTVNSYRELRIKQVFFKINSQLLADVIRSHYNSNLYISYHWFEGSHYIVVNVPNENFKNELFKVTQGIHEIAKKKLGWNDFKYIENKVLKKEIFLLNEEPKASMSVYSIGP